MPPGVTSPQSPRRGAQSATRGGTMHAPRAGAGAPGHHTVRNSARSADDYFYFSFTRPDSDRSATALITSAPSLPTHLLPESAECCRARSRECVRVHASTFIQKIHVFLQACFFCRPSPCLSRLAWPWGDVPALTRLAIAVVWTRLSPLFFRRGEASPSGQWGRPRAHTT